MLETIAFMSKWSHICVVPDGPVLRPVNSQVQIGLIIADLLYQYRVQLLTWLRSMCQSCRQHRLITIYRTKSSMRKTVWWHRSTRVVTLTAPRRRSMTQKQTVMDSNHFGCERRMQGGRTPVTACSGDVSLCVQSKRLVYWNTVRIAAWQVSECDWCVASPPRWRKNLDFFAGDQIIRISNWWLVNWNNIPRQSSST